MKTSRNLKIRTNSVIIVGQQLYETSISNIAVGSYDSDTYFGYVCTVTLALEMWSWVKIMTHLLVMDESCVKYYPDRT